MPKMADSTKPGKNQGKRVTNDENYLALSSLLAGANASSTSNYDPATLLCKLIQWNWIKIPSMFYVGISYHILILFGLYSIV